MASLRLCLGDRTWRAALLVAILLYLALALPQLHLPGLHYDEAKEAGVNAMELLLGQPVTAFRGAGIRLGNALLPLMVQDYIGALNVYLAIPFLAALGVNTPALRLLGVACGLLTLLLTWTLGQELSRLAGRRPGPIAGVAVLLLAASPTFVFWSRQGVFVTNVVATLAVATATLLLRWRRTGRSSALYLAAWTAGWAVWAKLLAAWVLVALGLVAALAWVVGQRRRSPEASSQRTAALTRRSALLAALIFLAALSPMLAFNVQTGGTLAAVLNNLERSYYGVDNTAFLPNLGTRLGQLPALLRGDHLWYLGKAPANRWAPPVALALGLAGAAQALGRARRPEGRQPAATLLAVWLVVALVVVQSSFTASDLFITHFAVLLPFLALAIAASADALVGPIAAEIDLPWRRWRGVAAALLLAAWIVGDAASTVRYHRSLAATGGYGGHTAAIYRLAQWLDAAGASQPAAMDWGIEAPVRFLTQNRVQPIEAFGYTRLDAPDEDFPRRVQQLLAAPDRLYIFHMPEDMVFRGRDQALAAIVQQQGRTLTIVDAIYDFTGRPVFVVLRAD